MGAAVVHHDRPAPDGSEAPHAGPRVLLGQDEAMPLRDDLQVV